MPTEKELMLKQADAETTYQKKLTAGTNITIDPVTNVISSAGGGSTVQYTDNVPNGESVGILAINGQSHPIRIPRLSEGTGITINKDITTNVYTISLSGGGGGTTKTYMGRTDPDELVGEDGDLYFKYHKIETDIPTELTLPSLPDDATVPFPITNFNSYESFTFYYTDLNREPHSRTVNTGDLVISDSPADESPNSNIYMGNSYCFVQATRSTNGEGLVLRVCGNCLYKLEANVTEVDLGIDKSYAKVEDTWLPSGEQVEANPEETSETPLTKIKIDGVTYYIAAGGSAEIVPLTKAEWDALPASKYTDNILYLITDSFTTDTIITPNPEGEATDTLTKLQIDETIYSLAGESGAAAIEKTQAEYNALTPEQKENGAIYMVQAGEQPQDTSGTFVTGSTQYEKVEVNCGFRPDYIEVTLPFSSGDTTAIYDASVSTTTSTWEIPQESNKYTIELGSVTGETGITDITDTGFKFRCNASNTRGVTCTFTASKEGQDAVNKIYYMGTEYANTNGGSGGGGGSDGKITTLAESQSIIFAPNDTITLSDSINNYDLIICFHKYSNGEIFTSTSISVEDLMATTLRVNTYYGDVGYNYINYVDETTLTNDVQSNVGIYKIIGIKFGSGGGSSIIPNPEEEPTDTLNSVKIDGTVYNIESNSEGEGVEIYSEDEYIVGKWIDGKKLYQKTYHLAQAITVAGGGTWTNTGVDISDIETLVDSKFSQDIAVWDAINGINDNGVLKATILASGSLTVDTITLRYTKTVETDAPAWGGSVTNYYANFIDTDNVIYSTISSSTTDTYTATEDCYVMQDIVTGSTVSTVNVDGEAVAEYLVSGTQIISYNAFLKKGQVLTVTHGGTAQHTIKVFGITYASGGSSSESSVHYSTTEQVIGTWLNNKPLYQKTYENLNIGTDRNYSLTLSDLQNIEYLRVVPEGSQVSALVPFPYSHYNSNNNISYFIDSITNGVPTLAIRKGSEMSSQSNLQFLTIQYTKTTD